MPSRQRINVGYRGTGGGGSTATFGNLLLGPDFGEGAGVDGKTFSAKAEADLDKIDVSGIVDLGVNMDLFSVDLVNNKTVGVDQTGDLGYANTKSVGVNADLFTVDVTAADEEVRVNLSKTLALANTKSVGVHLSGSVIAAPFYQGLSSVHSTGAGVTSVAVSTQSTTAVGDLIIAIVGVHGPAGANTITPNEAGWTTINSAFQIGALSAGIAAYWRVATVAGVTAYTFNFGALAGGYAMAINVIGFNTSNPINVNAVNTGTTTDPVSASITTTVNNCLLFAACSQAGVLDQAYTPPAGYTERVEGSSGTPTVTLNEEMATKYLSTAGASGTATHDSDQLAGTNYATIHFAVEPGSFPIAA